MTEVLLEARCLGARLGERRRFFRKDEKGFPVLSNVSFSLGRGEIMALVGESGSGKTTLARAIAGLVKIQKGNLIFNGNSMVDSSSVASIATGNREWLSRWKNHRKDIQLIFQDSLSSLNPRRTIGESLAVPIRNFNSSGSGHIDKTVDSLLDQVGLPREFKFHYPHRISGGQRQRACIARALASRPKLIIADEVVSGLDVSSQARILRLFLRLRKECNLSVLFITHDLAVVRSVADRVLVMQRGKIREEGYVEQVFSAPSHSYTAKLLHAVPSLEYEPDWLSKNARGEFAMNIRNSIAFVTGANRGIGSHFVEGLLNRGVGKIYAAARDERAIAANPRVIPIRLDITDAGAVAKAAGQASDVTLLINNAGYNGNSGALKSPTMEDARREMEVNYFGTLSMIRTFAPVLKRNGGGCIVNMLSILSRVALPIMGTLCASKAAGLSMTQAVRAELKIQGTSVIAVMPGAVDTDMSKDFPPPKADPADVARAVLNAIEAGDRDDIYPGDMAEGLRAGLEHDPKEIEAEMSQYLP
ncbi:MAG: SDR family oxidoreductase [Roseovarius sp.]|nr:SDR family oxidoreductase [Roseovarius sp.]